MVPLLFTILLLSCSFYAARSDIVAIDGGISGTGITTRYWDCCKPSCAWTANAEIDPPVASCAADGVTKLSADTQSGCDAGGSAYMCSNQTPTVINSTLAYGFAAASFTGGADEHMCCACVLLSFQGDLAPKQMVVQLTNTGSDLNQNQFDIAIPGGGVGLYTTGCSTQWNTPSEGWGDRITGVTSESDCASLPSDLQEGCKYRFDFMEGIPNPDVSFVQVECPSELIAISGCKR